MVMNNEYEACIQQSSKRLIIAHKFKPLGEAPHNWLTETFALYGSRICA